MNSAKQAGHLFSPQSSLVIVYASGMYGMLASAHNDSQMLLRNIRESKIVCKRHVTRIDFLCNNVALEIVVKNPPF